VKLRETWTGRGCFAVHPKKRSGIDHDGGQLVARGEGL
jgi:hypothetical protein